LRRDEASREQYAFQEGRLFPNVFRTPAVFSFESCCVAGLKSFATPELRANGAVFSPPFG
jgi:hypothetical protein